MMYGKGSIFATARALKRHQASCRPARDWSRKGTKMPQASERRKRVRKRVEQAMAQRLCKVNGTALEDYGKANVVFCVDSLYV
jgi:hypothetical protein